MKKCFCLKSILTSSRVLKKLYANDTVTEFSVFSSYTICELFLEFLFTIPGTIFTNELKSELFELMKLTRENVKHNVDFILKDQGIFPYLHRFLKKSYTSENYDCWLIVKKFKEINPEDHNSLESVSNNIENTFLGSKVPEEVNVSDSIKKNIKSCPLSPSKYDTLYYELTKTLHFNTVPMFLDSSEYSNYLQENIPTDMEEKIIKELNSIFNKMPVIRLKLLRQIINILKKVLKLNANMDQKTKNILKHISMKLFQLDDAESSEGKISSLTLKFLTQKNIPSNL